MINNYQKPEFEIIKFSVNDELLATSDLNGGLIDGDEGFIDGDIIFPE